MKTYLVKNQRRGNELDFFDDAFENFFKPMFYDEQYNTMKTDIREDENSYIMDIEIPGFDKGDIKLSLEDGYMTVSAEKKQVSENKKQNFIRRERNFSCSRSYYVGDVEESAVKAKYADGVLAVVIPKDQPKVVSSHYIAID